MKRLIVILFIILGVTSLQADFRSDMKAFGDFIDTDHYGNFQKRMYIKINGTSQERNCKRAKKDFLNNLEQITRVIESKKYNSKKRKMVIRSYAKKMKGISDRLETHCYSSEGQTELYSVMQNGAKRAYNKLYLNEIR